MVKKLLSLLCAVTMMIALVGCRNETEESKATSQAQSSAASSTQTSVAEEKKEPVELVYWYRNGVGTQEYTQEVEDKLNEILTATPGYEHITLKLHPCNDYKTDFALAQTSGEQIDIVSTPTLSEETEIKNGSFMPLDDLIAANPEIVEELPEWFLDYGVVDGVTYYVPNYQQLANQFYMYVNKEYFEQTDYTYEEVDEILHSGDFEKRAKFLEDLFYSAREYSGKETLFIGDDTISNIRSWVQPSNSIYAMSWSSYFLWDEEQEKIVFSDQLDSVKQGYLQNGEWYEGGYMLKSGEAESDTLFADGLLGDYAPVVKYLQSSGSAQMVADSMNTVKENVELNGEVVVWDFFDYIFIPNKNAAGGTAISSTCEHPEDAAKVLALLFNSKYEEFYNTLVYGLEGIHYEKVSDGIVNTLEFSGTQGGAETTYCFHKWRGGNTFNAWLNQSLSQEQEDYILNVINEGDDNVISPLLGFTLNTKPVENELAQILTVQKEYIATLQCGTLGAETENYYNEYMTKLEAAGLSKVLKEFNDQADAFLSR